MNNISIRLKFALSGIFILVLGIGIWLILHREEIVFIKSLPEEGEKSCPRCSLVVKGIHAQEVEEGNKQKYSLNAEELRINPRGFGIFLIQPVKEAILFNSFIEVYLLVQNNLQKELDLFPFSLISSVAASSEKKDKRFTASSIGLITRLVFKRLHFNIYRGNDLSISIYASEALTNFKNKETTFKEFRIEHKPSKKIILTQSAKWDAKEKVFQIPGEYLAITPRGKAKAKGIKVNLDFKVEKM